MADRYMVRIIADYDDGNYVEESTECSEEEYKKLRPVLDRVVGVLHKKHGSWETKECGNSEEQYVEDGYLSAEDAEIFSSIVPSGQYGIHTIESIDAYRFSQIERIY